MQRILVATDFSTRSDRAIRRASHLAREHGASLSLLHVVDDDRPPALVEAEQSAAGPLLEDLAATLRSADGLACTAILRRGEPFATILAVAGEVEADLVLLGPHRREFLRDVFVGTTAERVIRGGTRPVLMANAVPARSYRRIVLATDLSEGSAAAARVLAALGLAHARELVALHAFSAPAATTMLRTPIGAAEAAAYLATERREAAAALARFLAEVGQGRARRVLVPGREPVADRLLEAARRLRADLLVAGTRGRTGLARLVLGSVVARLLVKAEIDVLAVPPLPDGSAPARA